MTNRSEKIRSEAVQELDERLLGRRLPGSPEVREAFLIMLQKMVNESGED